MSCRVCAESTHGAWPRWHRGTHCRGCHQSWTGVQAAHALCCHRTFTSNNAADQHLVKGHCTDPGLLVGFELIERGGNWYWMPTSGVIRGGFAGAEGTT